MGVQGLLPGLQAAAEQVDFVKECRGQRNGFDGHVWLHTFCLVHYQDWVVGKDCTPVVDSFVQRARKLLAQGMHVTIILDGKRMPGKAATNAARQEKRAAAYAKAMGTTSPEMKARCLKACIRQQQLQQVAVADDDDVNLRF